MGKRIEEDPLEEYKKEKTLCRVEKHFVGSTLQRKTLCRVEKIEKIDFSPNKMAYSEMFRKNIGKVGNNVKIRYFGFSNPVILI